jgi:hypothetical protein
MRTLRFEITFVFYIKDVDAVICPIISLIISNVENK